MTPDELKKLEEVVTSPRKVVTDSGSVEERSIDEIKKGLNLLDKKKSELNANGAKRPVLARLGIYGRINL